MRGAETFASFLLSFKETELHETRRLLEHALSIDPDYARAYVALSNTYTTAFANPVNDEYLSLAAAEAAHRLALKAVQLDPNLPAAHGQLGNALLRKCDHDVAISEFQKATVLNPNFSDWRFASALVYAGQSGRAIEVLEAHLRHDPFYPPLVSAWLGLAHYMLRQYRQALPPLRDCIARAPNLRAGRVWIAATFAQLDELEKARAEIAEVLRIEPTHTISGTARRLAIFKSREDAEHYFDGLRKAGLPER